jgi:uncharacterized repeat protein (TIGR03806 family)
MRSGLSFLTLIAVGSFLCTFSTCADQTGPEPQRKEFGLEKRVPWTGSKVQGSPEPPPPYRTELAFPKLPKFEEPLELTYAPGGNRLFVAGRWGKVWSFVNKKDVDKADLALELKSENGGKAVIYGFTVHPKFKENGQVFVTWIPEPDKDHQPKGSRVSRFTVKGEPPVIERESEKIIFEWPNGGHNGGCIRFGPDGFLYIATGDGSGIADQNNIGQDLGSIHAKLLRIDVDNPPPGKAYGIPKDNPFANKEGARPEVYAYGLRQLWRFSFDRMPERKEEKDAITEIRLFGDEGRLWGGEVGQDLWEMIYVIRPGGNYGWSVMEGTHPFRPERKKDEAEFVKPIVEHSHSDFRSITGGYVYHGRRLDFQDQYIYGDFDTGRIWTIEKRRNFKRDTGRSTVSYHPSEIARTTYRIVSFGEDADGELYFLDFTGGGIHQLVKAPDAKPQAAFPRKLSETGIFASTKDHKVAAGVIPYSVNAQLWGDHAYKERFLAIPGNGQIGFDEIEYPQPSPGAPLGWRFPDGTVLVKTFGMEMERGNPRSRKRLETRLLHFQQFPGTQEYGDQYWRGYTYVWNEEQTDAELLDEKGADRMLKIKVGNKTVEQNYRFPSRAECTLCHNNAAKFALGVNTLQMNRDHVYPSPNAAGPGIIANQLATLEHIGLFTNKLPSPPKDLPKLADFNDDKHPVDVRARSYLQSNCAHCHMKWGGGNAEFKLLSTISLHDMGIVNVNPAHGSFDIKGAKLIVPGHPEQSIIHQRMTMTGLGRMPHIGSRVVDEVGVKLVHDWIKAMPVK